jgi:hypothetical protein
LTVSCGVQLEKTHALIDALEIINLYGSDIIMYDREENNVNRDKYNSIKYRFKTDGLKKEFKAFPIIFNPNLKQIEKAGLKETCNCIITTAMLAWINLGITFEHIDLIRNTIILRDIKYSIKEKTLMNQFADTFLNINLGLVIL